MLAVLATFSGCASTAPIPIARDDIQEKKLSTFKAAEDVWNGLEDRRRNGEAFTTAFLESEYVWLRRLAEAQCACAENDADRVQIIENHLKRMQNIAHLIEHWIVENGASSVQLAQLKYYVAQAELWVAEAKQK